jgi:hypothetical protein
MWSSSFRKRALIMTAVMLAVAGFARTPAHAQWVTPTPPNIPWVSLTPPNIPLTLGMTPEQVSQALGVQLVYVRGRPGDELLLALPNVKGAAFASRSDIYLQFRHGRLSGWKGDWGMIGPWGAIGP